MRYTTDRWLPLLLAMLLAVAPVAQSLAGVMPQAVDPSMQTQHAAHADHQAMAVGESSCQECHSVDGCEANTCHCLQCGSCLAPLITLHRFMRFETQTMQSGLLSATPPAKPGHPPFRPPRA